MVAEKESIYLDWAWFTSYWKSGISVILLYSPSNLAKCSRHCHAHPGFYPPRPGQDYP